MCLTSKNNFWQKTELNVDSHTTSDSDSKIIHFARNQSNRAPVVRSDCFTDNILMPGLCYSTIFDRRFRHGYWQELPLRHDHQWLQSHRHFYSGVLSYRHSYKGALSKGSKQQLSLIHTHTAIGKNFLWGVAILRVHSRTRLLQKTPIDRCHQRLLERHWSWLQSQTRHGETWCSTKLRTNRSKAREQFIVQANMAAAQKTCPWTQPYSKSVSSRNTEQWL